LLKFRYLLQFIIQTHCQQNKKIKRANQIFSEVYGTTLRRLVAAKPYTPFPFWKFFFPLALFFFHILEENYRKERKILIYICSHYIFLFAIFRLQLKKKKKKKKKQYKNIKREYMLFFFKKGGGRALRL
jgi:hypothetical protein